MLDAHAYAMQVKLCKANTRGVTLFVWTSRAQTAPIKCAWNSCVLSIPVTVPSMFASTPPITRVDKLTIHATVLINYSNFTNVTSLN